METNLAMKEKNESEKSTASIILNGEILKASLQISGTRQGCLLLLFNTVLEVLPEQSGKAKKQKASKLERRKEDYLFTEDMILHVGNFKEAILFLPHPQEKPLELIEEFSSYWM